MLLPAKANTRPPNGYSSHLPACWFVQQTHLQGHVDVLIATQQEEVHPDVCRISAAGKEPWDDCYSSLLIDHNIGFAKNAETS